MIWGHDCNNRVSKNFRAEDCVANRRIEDETYLGGAVCERFDGLVSAACNNIEQDIRILLVIVAKNRSYEAFDRGLKRVNIDRPWRFCRAAIWDFVRANSRIMPSTLD